MYVYVSMFNSNVFTIAQSCRVENIPRISENVYISLQRINREYQFNVYARTVNCILVKFLLRVLMQSLFSKTVVSKS